MTVSVIGSPIGVYPRVCGGTSLSPTPNPDLVEAVYPRVCGGTRTVQRSKCKSGAWGSIPACAGEPSVYERKTTPAGVPLVVYPRVCGGTAEGRTREHQPTAVGLSPRVRGNR